MSDRKKIKSALISVFDKDGLAPIAQELNKNGVTIYSTGGTQAFIEDLGINVERVEDLTSYPSILGGRVKTLHPKVFGGILNRRDLADDQAQIAEYDIPEIDLVVQCEPPRDVDSCVPSLPLRWLSRPFPPQPPSPAAGTSIAPAGRAGPVRKVRR